MTRADNAQYIVIVNAVRSRQRFKQSAWSNDIFSLTLRQACAVTDARAEH